MKHLIVYAHPNAGSLNNHFKQSVVNTLQRSNCEVVVRDLYELNFNPILSMGDMQGQRKGVVDTDVKVEQEYIKWADQLTFIYPIWWTGMPAIMKGYIDRVMSYGFAYRYDNGIQKGLLNDKSVVIINTQGKSKEEYKEIGMDTALSLTSDRGVYQYCGLKIKKHFFFGKAERTSKEVIEEWTKEVLTIYEHAVQLL